MQNVHISSNRENEYKNYFVKKEHIDEVRGGVFLIHPSVGSDIYRHNNSLPIFQRILKQAIGEEVSSNLLLSSKGTDIDELKTGYRDFFEDQVGRRQGPIICFGFGNLGIQMVNFYYDLANICRPSAIVLLNCAAKMIDLNKITCPYFMIYDQGFLDRNLGTLEEVQMATHHHQMRYGDITTYLILAKSARNQESDLIFNRLMSEVTFWIERLKIF
jgi:hypothetical protein